MDLQFSPRRGLPLGRVRISYFIGFAHFLVRSIFGFHFSITSLFSSFLPPSHMRSITIVIALWVRPWVSVSLYRFCFGFSFCGSLPMGLCLFFLPLHPSSAVTLPAFPLWGCPWLSFDLSLIHLCASFWWFRLCHPLFSSVDIPSPSSPSLLSFCCWCPRSLYPTGWSIVVFSPFLFLLLSGLLRVRILFLSLVLCFVVVASLGCMRHGSLSSCVILSPLLSVLALLLLRAVQFLCIRGGSVWVFL